MYCAVKQAVRMAGPIASPPGFIRSISGCSMKRFICSPRQKVSGMPIRDSKLGIMAIIPSPKDRYNHLETAVAEGCPFRHRLKIPGRYTAEAMIMPAEKCMAEWAIVIIPFPVMSARGLPPWLWQTILLQISHQAMLKSFRFCLWYNGTRRCLSTPHASIEDTVIPCLASGEYRELSPRVQMKILPQAQ